MIQNIKFSQNREINMSRKFHVIRYLLMFHSDYSFWFTFCLVYGTTLCWLWLLIMAEHLLLVVITGLFVVKKEASGREGSEEWVLFMEKCCRGLESGVRSLFMWLTGTQPSSILQVCPHLLLRLDRVPPSVKWPVLCKTCWLFILVEKQNAINFCFLFLVRHREEF